MGESSLLDILRLTHVPGVGSVTYRKLVRVFGSPRAVLAAPGARLKEIPDLPLKAVQGILAAGEDRWAEEELARAGETGLTLIGLGDPGYPKPLLNTHDPPPILYCKGQLLPEDALAIAIVGSRQCSPYGRRQAEHLAGALTSAGFVVVSGLARGIDTAAHAGAAAHPSGRTLAVLGNSLEQVYPPENQKLAEHILDGHGALISELPLNTGPAAEHFPRRNRIIAGLSLGVIVVEGTETSGALITARYAVDMDREVFAVPGPVDSPKSRGPHRLIKQGAKLVEDIEDVLEELRDISQHLVQLKTPDPRLRLPKAGPGPDLPLFDPAAGQEKGCQDGRPTLTDLRAQNLNPKEQTLFALLDPHTPTGVDVLIQKSGLPASEVLSTLLVLEVRRLCRQLPGKRFLKS